MLQFIYSGMERKKKKRPLSYEGIIRDSRSDTVMPPCTLDLTHFLSFYDSAFTIPGFENFQDGHQNDNEMMK